ncbi:ubiquitin carboxyl-terminal hydrolase 37-like protein [Lates japonicus]|uniref:Ubiquitin carboxyl-terminal hydrolase 37-like protein n=1 Tax=Lates japonicus TaxID=270547 RepID=A0AAD3R495_LATJO|nr:ubiquitin carboxyl-terminal hydrolase 37-like protein [Lates japonicus]
MCLYVTSTTQAEIRKQHGKITDSISQCPAPDAPSAIQEKDITAPLRYRLFGRPLTKTRKEDPKNEKENATTSDGMKKKKKKTKKGRWWRSSKEEELEYRCNCGSDNIRPALFIPYQFRQGCCVLHFSQHHQLYYEQQEVKRTDEDPRPERMDGERTNHADVTGAGGRQSPQGGVPPESQVPPGFSLRGVSSLPQLLKPAP